MGWKAFVEGGLASVTAGVVTHPLDLIKVRMQLQQSMLARSPWSVGLELVKAEGARALFNGLSAAMLRQILYSATRLGLYDTMKKKWQGAAPDLPLPKKMSAALIAGGIGAAIGNPADVAMVRMQADGRLPTHQRRNYKGVVDAISQISKKEGILSMWRGSSLTVQRAAVVTVAQLASYDQIKEAIVYRKMMSDGVATHLTASVSAGLLAAIASNPIDVIKTRIMNMSIEPGRTAPYKNGIDCALKTVRCEGVMGLYKGFIPSCWRQAPFAIVMFVSLEQFRKLFKDF